MLEAGLFVLLATLALVLWNGMAERGCEERGGYIVQEYDYARWEIYDVCVEGP